MGRIPNTGYDYCWITKLEKSFVLKFYLERFTQRDCSFGFTPLSINKRMDECVGVIFSLSNQEFFYMVYYECSDGLRNLGIPWNTRLVTDELEKRGGEAI